jgi:hypothetical protein
MNLRPALLAAAAFAAALGICLALCRWSAGGNNDLAAVVQEVQRGQELDPHLAAGQRRDEARHALAAEVVAGRMTLREAAGHFRHLDEADRAYPPGIPRPLMDDQFFCKQVLNFVWVDLTHEQRYAAAARWYGEAFRVQPHLLAGPPAGQRYYAARAAARAGCGQGWDAADLDETSRAGFRRQARDWLRAALETRHQLLEQEPEKTRPTVADDMNAWLADPDFAGVREPEALARLPEAEREAWQKLWADVADTLARAVDMLPR